ncbi:ABC transporter ATP-binding protein [Moheibacter sediminis]|uniref:ABC-type Fe3+/spermidine/putrescine transport systems, ATPase components n=1 Tax=Moheibacter sediminis TaxID=1434700 RepID=A0A1W1Y7K4_9FLAO|nr:ABC transporter ATP-binding protein [Moheibacter sediminis]SMC32114.1 ABC-type Fe3+/spermidine/putrescine transport systems, ATPase components [Moheibacter sediminis]
MLEIRQLGFSFHENQSILEDINFEVKTGEILSILGESGSGKSTLLKLIYGLEDTVSGEIFYESDKVTGPKFNLVPGNSKMKFVPQEFDLLDSINVSENVGKYLSNFDLPLKSENTKKALKVVKMDSFANHFPSQLSGGQRQRVSIARAIATNPKMLLLDEPYSHLDQPLKFEIRKNIWNWAKETNCTVILTTHDVNDALGFSDKIIILKNGKIIQNDSPENLRNNPENEYVASLLGEYSILNADEMWNLFQIKISETQKAIIYPEEISEDESGQEFEISDVRFRGRDYLIETIHKNSKLKFYSILITENQFVKLKIKNFRLI